MSKRELKCLKVLVEHYNSDYNCLFFRYIAKATRLNQQQVRRSVRSLTRKGLAQLVRGLVDDDNMLAGSGYCATQRGVGYIDEKNYDIK